MLAQFISLAIAAVKDNWIIVSILSYVLYRVINRETRNVPPGPWGLPLVGYIPFFGKYSHLDCVELSKKYGPIFSIQLGLNNCVMINNIKLAIEAFNNDALIARPKGTIFDLIVHGGNPLTWNGDIWKEHRAFVFRGLRQVGLGKPKIERLIQDEIATLCNHVAKYEGKSCPFPKILAPSVSNVVMAVTVAERYDYDHPTRILLDKAFGSEMVVPFPFTGYLCNFIGIVYYLRKWMPAGFFSEIRKRNIDFRNYCQSVIAKRYNDPDEKEDLISGYLDVCDRNPDHKLFNKDHIEGIIGALIGAGSGTVKDSLQWITFYMAMNQDLQRKLVKEIMDNIGPDREPIFSDRQNMPYAQAVINESIRKSSFGPINLPRMATRDIKLGGYLIPKGTQVFINNYSLTNDPNYWKDPQVYRPERFLNEDGTKLIKHEAFMPFSAGRRQCPGESLAQIELFLYVCYLFQRFKVTLPDGIAQKEDPIFDGFTLVPNNLTLNFKPRQI